MIVSLVASTLMAFDGPGMGVVPDSIRGTEFEEFHDIISGMSADRLAHFAGRACYQAWNMPNPDTASDVGYLANIIKQGHFSVLEHASATFYIEGVSRSLTHELVRHRHLSYSQLSQRYVEMKDAEFVFPPALANDGSAESASLERDMHQHFEHAKRLYGETVNRLMARGMKRKQAREAARAILPNNTETKIVVTGNMRAWRDFLTKRYSVHADAEIQALATEILSQLRELAPGSFQDFPETPFE